MKKVILAIVLLAITIGVFGQNTFKYEIITPGLTVGTSGGDRVKLDSIISSGGIVSFYNGATELTTNAATVTGFTPASGSLTLSGADAITLTSTNTTNITLPTTGQLATTTDLSAYSPVSHTHDIGDLGENIIDSTKLVDSKLAFFIGADTASLHINTTDIIDLSDYANMLTDTVPYFVFGAGQGEDADSIAFAKGKKGFGTFNVVTDSLYVVNVDNLYISADDSLLFNVYYGNRMTGVASDSLFTAPQALGDNQTTFTPNNETTIPPGSDVWVGLIADQPTGYRPKEWNLQLNTYKIRD